jgi:hypothetical protein
LECKNIITLIWQNCHIGIFESLLTPSAYNNLCNYLESPCK